MSKEKLWEKILKESTQSRRYPEGNLILLGSRDRGKRALVTALQKGPGALGKTHFSELVNAGDSTGYTCPLHYTYLNSKNIEDPQSDKISHINVWSLDDPSLSELLEHAIKPELLSHTMLGLVIDWTKPWGFIEELHQWAAIWHEKLGKAISTLPLDEQDSLVARVEDHIRTFREHSDNQQKIPDEVLKDLPIPEGVLQVNMGVPIIVIATKVDMCWNVDKNRESAEKTLDFVLRALREFCITYGASLVYTSAKNNINITQLYNYILHRTYNFKLPVKAQILARDEIFIPSGWDSPKFIKDMDFLGLSDKQYDEVLPKPRQRTVASEDVQVTSDIEFLYQAKDKLLSSNKVTSTQKKDKEAKGVEKPNPGGEVNISEAPSGDTSARGTNALHSFYQKLLEKGSRDSTKEPVILKQRSKEDP